jgi:hypothetical protein
MLFSGTTLPATFWDANPLYNQVNLWIAIGGFLVTFFGLFLAIKTLFETKNAATAAKDATEKTRDQLGEFAAFIDMKSLGNHAREVASHIASNNLQSVTLRSADLRDGVARARASVRTKTLMEQPAWQEIIAKIVLVHELAGAYVNDRRRRMTADEKANCARLINEVADEFHRLSAIFEAKI